MTEAVLTVDSGIKRDKKPFWTSKSYQEGDFIMKSNKGKGLLGLLGLLVVLGIFGFFGYDTLQKSKLVTDENGVTSQNGGIKLGLDLAGGVSITYQAKEENPSAEDMSDTQYKLQQRVQNYSSEAEVYQEGGNRINVDIPGVRRAQDPGRAR